MVIHLNEKIRCAGHMMSMPYCGLDDSESAMYSDNIKDVTCKLCIKKYKKHGSKLEQRIKELKERIEMNNQDIEFGEDKDFKKISREDNKFCKPRLKELEKALSDAEVLEDEA